MTTKEFNLSEKIWDDEGEPEGKLKVEDVKIRLLKEEIENELQINTIRKSKTEFITIFENAIDKLAGKDLENK